LGIRIFTKKTFEFSRREMKDGVSVIAEKVTTRPFDFCDVPGWAESDPIFGWAKKDGDLEVISGKAEEKAVELKASKELSGSQPDAAKVQQGNQPQQQNAGNGNQRFQGKR